MTMDDYIAITRQQHGYVLHAAFSRKCYSRGH